MRGRLRRDALPPAELRGNETRSEQRPLDRLRGCFSVASRTTFQQAEEVR